MDVGKIEKIEIAGDHIVMKFTIGTESIGTESRLAIKTDTLLGKKVLEIEARGNQALRPGGTLPLGQSTTPYQIYDAFFDVTKAATGLGHRHRQEVTARAVGDHRPDLPAPEPCARRGGQVLRHDR